MAVATKPKKGSEKKPLTTAEKELLESGCLYLGGRISEDLCPAVEAKTAPYAYQRYGCRGIACKEVNSRYYSERYVPVKQKKVKKNGKRSMRR